MRSIEVFDRLSQPLRRGIARMLTRAVVRNVDDRNPGQVVDVSMTAEDDTVDAERAQPWGLSFVPPDGIEAMVAAIQSSLDHLVSFDIADRTHRPPGNHRKPGTGGLYGLKGWVVFITDDNRVLIGGNDADGPGGDGAKSNPGIEVDGEQNVKLGGLDASDFVALASLVLAELNDIRTKFDSHIHVTTATVGAGPTPGVIASPSAPMGSAGDVAATKVVAK